MEVRKRFDIFARFKDLKPVFMQTVEDSTVAEQYAKGLAQRLAGESFIECFIYSEHQLRILGRFSHVAEIAPAA